MKLCQMVRRRWNSTATEEVAGFQHLCANPSLPTPGKTYIRPPKTYSNIPSDTQCLMVTKRDFLEVSLRLNEKSQNGSKMEVSLEVGCLPYAVGKQPSTPLINCGRK